jgi:hypothetical protein
LIRHWSIRVCHSWYSTEASVCLSLDTPLKHPCVSLLILHWSIRVSQSWYATEASVCLSLDMPLKHPCVSLLIRHWSIRVSQSWYATEASVCPLTTAHLLSLHSSQGCLHMHAKHQSCCPRPHGMYVLFRTKDKTFSQRTSLCSLSYGSRQVEMLIYISMCFVDDAV